MDRLVRFGKDVVNGWLDAGAFTFAASLAYYAIFAIAPLLLISIHIASLFLDRTAAIEGLTSEMIRVIGPAGSDAIKQMLDAAGTAQPKGWSGLVAFGVLLFAATGFVGSLQEALDRKWDAPPRPGDIWSFIRPKLCSFSLVLAAADLLLVSLVLSTANRLGGPVHNSARASRRNRRDADSRRQFSASGSYFRGDLQIRGVSFRHMACGCGWWLVHSRLVRLRSVRARLVSRT